MITMHEILIGCVVALMAVAAGESPSTSQSQERPPGWEAEESAGDGSQATYEEPAVADLPAKEQARYDRVANRLVDAINRRDRAAYRALFTDEGWESSIEWWRDMFAEQIDSFGAIDRAWAPQPGVIKVGKLGAGNEWGGVGILVRFEEPVGGVLTVLLDDDDKITRTDVMIHRGLAAQEPEGLEVVYERAPTGR